MPIMRTHELFERCAEQTPTATAVASARESLTYDELNRRANRLARHLQALGVRPETPVAVGIDRRAELIVALLAIHKAGGAFVPIDPGYPDERQALILADCGAALALTCRADAGRFAAARSGASVLQVDADASAWRHLPDTAPGSEATPASLAYVIYTSGSTGKPKGVMVEHRQLVATLTAAGRELGVRPADVVPWHASPAFDIALLEILMPLAHGAAVQPVAAGKDLTDLVKSTGDVTFFHGVPSLMDAWLQHLGDGARRLYPRLRCLLVGGEAVPRTLLVALKERFPDAEVVELYGPTEATIICSGLRVAPESLPDVPHCLGRPFAGTAAYIVDAAMRLVPDGEYGELCLGGPTIARGYLRRPELTARAFLADPFSQEGGAAAGGRRLYRTGDVVRRLPGGMLEFLGRLDEQVKIRGFRIELGEIEQRLKQDDRVKDAVVIARDGRLVAYVVPARGTTRGSELTAELRRHLPEHMVPAGVVMLEALPLNHNGKVDKGALPHPAPDAPGTPGPAPASPREQLLAKVFASVLRRDGVGAHDDFFALGGDSIAALHVVTQAGRAGLRLSSRQVFAHRTVAALALVAAESDLAAGASAAHAPCDAEPAPHELLPLTPLQEGMLFHSLVDQAAGTYIVHFSWTLTGLLDVTAFQEAWRLVVNRHESLLASFVVGTGERPRQRIHAGVALPWSVHDWRHMPAAEQLRELAAFAAMERRRGFRVDEAPLMRFAIVQLSDRSWRFHWTHHHALLDGWSLPLLLGEVFKAYSALAAGQPFDMPEPISYVACARQLAGRDWSAARAFWKDELSGFSTPTPLVVDQPVAAAAERCRDHVHSLGASLTGSLGELARGEGLTLHTLIQGAWAILLSRYSGEQDVLFGATVSGRLEGLPGIDGVIGSFLSTVPVRAAVPAGARLVPWLKAAQQRQAERSTHAHMGLAELQRYTDVPPELELFETLVVSQGFPACALTDAPGRLAMDGFEAREHTNYPLTLRIDAGSDVTVTFSYQEARFPEATIRRLAGHLEALLAGFVTTGDARLADLPIMSDAERHAILVGFNDTDVSYPDDLCVHQLFERQVDRTPRTLAYRYEGRDLTYAELEAKANQLARHLRDRGVRNGAYVGLCCTRSPEMMVAVLAILKAGAAYVPIDPAYPQARIKALLEDAKPVLVLAQAALQGRLPEDLRVVALDDACPDWGGLPTVRLEIGVRASDPAYVIFTSGTTGRPKGALNLHAGVCNRLLWMQDRYRLASDDRVLQKTPYSFDVSVWELFWPLLAGAAVVMARPDGHRDPTYLVGLIGRERITTLHFVPSMLQPFLEELKHEGARCASIRRLICSGEALAPDLVKRCRQALPETELHNLYGPTECAVDVTAWECPEDAAVALVPIGRPIANTKVYVLDAQGQPTPMGIPGELYVGGVQVGAGYVNQPVLTAERFLPDPWSRRPEARLYRTGDLARWLPDGTLAYLGRLDEQVKIRGVRIELAEVQAQLLSHERVREAVAVACEDRPGVKRLVAYVVAQANAPLAPGDLRAYLETRLPEAMIPAAVVFLEALPLSPNGKVDRRRLPAPDPAGGETAFVAPRTPVEAALAEAGGKVLGSTRVSMADRFFALGGDSILLLQVVALVREAGWQLSARQAFEGATLAEVAASARPVRAVAAAESQPDTGVLTPLQAAFFAARHPDPDHYHQSVRLAWRSPPDHGALAKALQALALHHDALRLQFDHAGRARLAPEAALPERAWLAEASECEVHAAIHLGKPPLLRAGMLGPRDTLLVAHHLAVDGVSWRILLEDLASAYRQALAGAPVRLPTKTSAFLAWTSRLKEAGASATVGAERELWTRAMTADARLPLDRPAPRGGVTAATLAHVELALAADHTAALDRPNEALLTALADVLSVWCDRDEVRIDVEGHGREDLSDDGDDGGDVSRTVGWLTSRFPLVLRRGADMGETFRALPRRGIGYGILRHFTGAFGEGEEDTADLCFNYLGRLGQPDLGPEALFTAVHRIAGPNAGPGYRRPHFIDLTAYTQDGRLVMVWSYSADLHDRRTIERLAETLVQRLAASRPASAAAAYPLTPMQEGMLFHTLMAPAGGAYVEHYSWALEELDAEAYRRAWLTVVDRHDVFRTSFAWAGKAEAPRQKVHAKVELPWAQLDWRHLSAGEQAAGLARLAEEAVARGFAPGTAPLMHLTLVRVSDDRWRCLWALHHALIDGWSLPVVQRELAVAYAAHRAGRVPDLPSPRPFADYVRWLERQDMEAAASFWADELKDLSAITALPLGSPEPVHESPYEERTFGLAPELVGRLQGLARREGLTLNTVFQGAWALLLARYGGESEVVFGAAVAGRPVTLRGADRMVGPFVNTLPVRVAVPTALRLAPWLRVLQSRQAARAEFAYYPLPKIQRAAPLPAGTPLFETLMVFENYPASGAGKPLDLEVRAHSNYPLSVIVETDPTVTVTLSYQSKRLSGADAEQLGARLQALLAAMAADPDQAVANLSIFLPGERARLLTEFAGPVRSYAPFIAAHQMFEGHAVANPDAAAVVCGDVSLTYGELNGRANALARRLLAAGVGREARVAVSVERSVDVIVAFLGILKAGGAYVPLDPTLPAERLAFMMEDAEPRAVLTQRRVRERVPATSAPVIVLDEDPGEPAPCGAATANPHIAVAPGDLAYVIYTSGSTGRPKGVLLEHRGLANLTRTQTEIFGLSAASRVLQFASFVFDGSISDFMMALGAGGCLVIVPAEARVSGPALGEYLTGHRVTAGTLPPAALRLLEDATLPELVCLITAGDVCSAELVERWGRGRALFNAYGPTEATVCVTAGLCQPGGTGGEPPGIGRPVANTALRILDARGELAPIGVAGELCVAGVQVARGYLRRPELTAERFSRDPLSADPAVRLYRTGDLARWRSDGTVEYIGRADRQVKIRGFRIELEEIERRLAELPAVREAAVILREDRPGEKRLAAYLVPASGHGVDLAAVRRHLRLALPEYMVPAAFVTLTEMPLGPTGKIDRRRLPPPRVELRDTAYVAPRDALEAALAALAADLLGVPTLSINDHFFELGGDSLLATRLVSRLRRTLQVDLPLRAVFENPTVAGLAREAGAARGVAEAVVPRLPRPVGTAPASFAQERLWFLDHLERQSSGRSSQAYLAPAVVALQGRLDAACLQRALELLIERHEVLRTRLIEREGRVSQAIDAPPAVPLPLTDLRGMPVAERAKAEERLIHELVAAGFDLGSEIPIRAALIRTTDDRHVLILNVHHAATDGWSFTLLTRELGAIYEGLGTGSMPPLAALPVQYADYAAWERGSGREGELAGELAYWRRELEGLPPLLMLPTDRARPKTPSFRGAVCEFALDPALTQALKALSEAEGTTLFMTLAASLVVFLGRHAGQDDVAIGTPVAGRLSADLEGLVGLFANTLVLRARPETAKPFADLLQEVKQTCLNAYAHQAVPFERLVRELNPDRDLARSPLFQVMLTLATGDGATLSLPGLVATPLPVPRTVAKFDLSLSMAERDGRLVGAFEYSTDLFDAPSLGRMAERLVTLLQGIVTDPRCAVGRLPLIGSGEQDLVLGAFNAERADYPIDRCIHELVEARVAANPDAPALRYLGTTLSYGELNEKANRLARYLGRQGVGPGILVGLCTERSLEMVIGMLAVLKAGGAYVPIDPEYPRDRVELMLEDTQAAVLLTQEHVLGTLPPAACRMLCLDRDAPLWDDELPTDLGRVAAPDDLAYVIYTSGSTGRPKGAMNEHRGVVTYLCWMQEFYKYSAADRALQKTPYSFDASVWEFYLPLISGAILVMTKPGGHRDTAYLAETIRRERITMMIFVPSLLRALLEEPEFARCDALRTVLCGGEALPYELTRRFFATFKGVELFNRYGPTECAPSVTTWPVPVEPEDERVPIGRPNANTRLYVLDPFGAPTPIGVAGELHIGGAQVGRGYWRRPGLTAERFLPDPFTADQAARLYKTGDLARWLPGGTIEFLGRGDHQVKLRGFRIELGEIEARLLEWTQVRAAVVVAREDSPGNRRLVAYVVPEPGAAWGVAALRDHLRSRLPEYMVPSAFVVLAELPHTHNGKVDRQRLPAPDYQGGAAAGPATDTPRRPVESAVAEMMAALLGVPRIGLDESFFDLGGDSLMATRLVSRLRRTLLADVPLQAVFESPRARGLARFIEGAAKEALEPIPVLPRDGAPLPASFAQERLWFLHQLETGGALGLASSTYAAPLALRLAGALDVAALRRALAALAARHEALRTRLAESQGQVRQIVTLDPVLDLPVTDLRELPPEARPAAERRRLAEFFAAGFDLERDPLFRAALLRVDDATYILLISMHHLIGDGWSTGILSRELSSLYAAAVTSEAHGLPPLPLQYADYAAWQRNHAGAEALRDHLDYWAAALAGLPPSLDLPTDRPRPLMQSFRGGSHSFALSPELCKALRELCEAQGVTLFMVVAAVYALLLGRHANQSEVAIGTPVAGRTRDDLEGLIGLFVNTLVLRVGIQPAMTGTELLAAVKKTCLEAYAHQDVPFEQLVARLSPDRSLAQSPLFQAMLSLETEGQGAWSLPGVQVTPIHGAKTTAKFDLTLALFVGAEGITGAFEYSADLFEAATIVRLTGHFINILSGLTRAPEAGIGALPWLEPAERHELLASFNDAARPWPQDACAHELFEAQVERTPEAIAIMVPEVGQGPFAGEAWSYRELNRRANRLAHHLIAKGIGPGALVAVSCERGPGMVVALLGILKAGGAYVPIDPGYPAERIRAMTEGVALRLTPADLDAADWQAASDANPLRRAAPSDLAYVIYTSGSTGKPKGAMIEHHGLCNLAYAQLELFGLSPGCRVLQLASYSFDVSLSEVFMALASGGVLFLTDETTRYPGPELAQLLTEGRIQYATMTPTALKALPEGRYPDLTTLIVGGEVCPPELVAAWAPGRRMFNAYGPTEVSNYATVGECVAGGARPPIGRPIANRRVYILDAQRQPVPIGVAGEIYIGGVGVGRGYLSAPELTQERFVPDPFAGDPGARMYRSGDLARWLPDGSVDFLGRLDHQVKVRGFRIELGEIESRLAGAPGVGAAVVTLREDRPGDKRLAAYLVPAAGPALDLAVVRQHLKAFLPDYMIPAAYVILEALPLTQNGKIDRSRLPAPVLETGESSFVAPRTPTEAALATIIAGVLGVSRVGVNDEFFTMGGDSIQVLQVVARAKDAGLTITARQMFEAQTLGDLAKLARKASGVRAEEGAIAGTLPLTPIQRQYLAQAQPRPEHYNQSVLLRFGRDVDVQALARALAALPVHHDALRIRFQRTPAGWQAWNAPPGDPASLGFEAREEAFSQDAAAEIQTGLDLERGPLVRAALFLNEEPRLLLVVHHLLVDAVSWRILLEDLASAYRQAQAGAGTSTIKLAAKSTSFYDWAHRLQHHATTHALTAEAPLWERARRAGARLPVDIESGLAENTVGSREQVRVALSAEQTRALLQELPGAQQTQINDALLTALAETLGGWCDASEVLVDVEGHGREELFDDLSVSRTVGWFTSIFPVALRLPPGGPVAHLQAVKEQLRAIPHHGVGYGILRQMGEGAGEPWPTAELCFNYLGQLGSGQGSAPFTLARDPQGPTRAPGQRRAYLLEVNAHVADGRLSVQWSFSRNVHRRDTVEMLARDYLERLGHLIDRGVSRGAATVRDEEGVREDLADLKGKIDAVVQAQIHAHRAVGVVVGLVRDGTTELWGYGQTRRGGAAPPSDALYQIGSISKSFTGILLADAVIRGLVTLDDPVAADHLLPELRATAAATVTLRELATHTSGLPHPGHIMAPLAAEAESGADSSVARMLAYLQPPFRLKARPSVFTRSTYSSLGVSLLGLALARVNGRPFDELVKERLTEPLGLADTVVRLTAEQRERLAQPHSDILEPVPPCPSVTLSEPASGIYATAHDMLRFVEANLRPPASLLGEAIRLSHVPLIAGVSENIGMCWFVGGKGGPHEVWQSGGTKGANCLVAIDAARRLGLVVMSNCKLAVQCVEEIVFGKRYSLVDLGIDLGDTAARAITGTYDLGRFGRITVKRKLNFVFCDGLTFPDVPAAVRLNAKSEVAFSSSDRSVRAAFDKDAAGEVAGIKLTVRGQQITGTKVLDHRFLHA